MKLWIGLGGTEWGFKPAEYVQLKLLTRDVWLQLVIVEGMPEGEVIVS